MRRIPCISRMPNGARWPRSSRATNFGRLATKTTPETRVDAEMVVFGTFVMAGGPIKAIDAQAGTISIQNLPTKKPLTVVINKDSVLRRIPEQMAMMMARRLQAAENGTGVTPGGPAGNLGGPGPGRAGTGQPGGPGGQGQVRANRGGEGQMPGGQMGPGGPRRGGGDLSEMFQRLTGRVPSGPEAGRIDHGVKHGRQ